MIDIAEFLDDGNVTIKKEITSASVASTATDSPQQRD